MHWVNDILLFIFQSHWQCCCWLWWWRGWGGEVKTYQIWQQELGLLKMMRVMMIVRKESLSEKFICSVATTVSRRLTSENTNKDSTKMRDSIFVIMKAAPKLSLDWAIMAFTEIVLRVPLAVIVEKFCPAILRRGMPPPSLARILARVRCSTKQRITEKSNFNIK